MQMSVVIWWASKYWWSLEIVEQGAFNFLETIRSIHGAPKRVRERADADFLKQAYQAHTPRVSLMYGGYITLVIAWEPTK